jgi:3D-(3,5/4)-trihydroxycyclohexane-1,2-dione acylhydrolase (decyclizing)
MAMSAAAAAMRGRAHAVADAGSIEAALAADMLPAHAELTAAEALVLGLLKQDVRKYAVVLGHGNTALGEILRVYDEAGATRTFAFRNEIAMSHAVSALRWQYGERAALATSIGPGAMQAMAASLAAASNGIGVWHLYGDETTHDEGYNMQQIPKPEQGLYGRLTACFGESYVLHEPGALRAALRRGAYRVDHPYFAGPFYLMLPINVQPRISTVNLAALPGPSAAPRMAVFDDDAIQAAAALIRGHRRIAIKVGGGGRSFASEIRALAEMADGVAVLSPGALGVLPDASPRNMHVGGSKGSISGNFAAGECDLLIMIGSRAVCQADCSGTAFAKAQAVININGDLRDATHYNRTVALVGDIGACIHRLLAVLGAAPPSAAPEWRAACAVRKAEWTALRASRTRQRLHDPLWQRELLTQPAAIHVVAEFARSVNAVKYFDAGDVQANGFQVVADDSPGETYTETGASYMGFAASAIAAGAMADAPCYAIAFCGDGSFIMNPQILIDAVALGARGMIVVFDNRRMGAISGLQEAQYGAAFATSDGVAVDYAAMARAVSGVAAFSAGDTAESLRAALERAYRHPGLSLVHVPVYYGPDARGGMGAYGSWNVGSWCAEVEALYHAQQL